MAVSVFMFVGGDTHVMGAVSIAFAAVCFITGTRGRFEPGFGLST
jgi:hypothetical protein